MLRILQTSLSISFMDAVKGVERTISVNSLGACSPCSGSGEKAGTKATKCTTCRGTGVVRHALIQASLTHRVFLFAFRLRRVDGAELGLLRGAAAVRGVRRAGPEAHTVPRLRRLR